MATKRKQTPDVLASVLGTSPASDEAQEETPVEKVEKKASPRTPAKRGQGRGAQKKAAERKAEASKPAETVDKQKATFSMSQTVLDELDDTWMRLRKMSRRKKGTVTKSEIVEVALQAVLEDFQSRGKQSDLARTMLE